MKIRKQGVMIEKEKEGLFKQDGDVGYMTRTVSIVLDEDFSVKDVRIIQKFLKRLLETRSRLMSE